MPRVVGAEQGQVWVSALAAEQPCEAPAAALGRMRPKFYPSPKHGCLHQSCGYDISVKCRCPPVPCAWVQVARFPREDREVLLTIGWEAGAPASSPQLHRTSLESTAEPWHSGSGWVEAPRVLLLQPDHREAKSSKAKEPKEGKPEATGSDTCWFGRGTGTWGFAACFLPLLWLSSVPGQCELHKWLCLSEKTLKFLKQQNLSVPILQMKHMVQHNATLRMELISEISFLYSLAML